MIKVERRKIFLQIKIMLINILIDAGNYNFMKKVDRIDVIFMFLKQNI